MSRFVVLVLLCLAVTASLTVGVASAKASGRAWVATSYKVSQAIPAKYSVRSARCRPLVYKADQQSYGAYSELLSNGTIAWTAVLCWLVMPDNSACYAVAHITGAPWDAFHLGTFRFRGCTPYQITRRLASAGATA
jgi:hypothetical protein